jgi:hypothetical protein
MARQYCKNTLFGYDEMMDFRAKINERALSILSSPVEFVIFQIGREKINVFMTTDY